MEKKITIARSVLTVLSLGMLACSILAHHEVSQSLSSGDPTQMTRLVMPESHNGIPVEITTPHETTWKYVDFSQSQSLAEWLNNMGEELFGKMAYAQSAPAAAQPGVPGQAVGQALPLQEQLPRAPNTVHIVARHKDGTIFYDQTIHNLRTNAGINWQYGQMAGGTAAVCTYIALSNSGATPAATDTALASEITSNGLARALATPSHTANASSYTLGYTFTATASQAAQNAGMLNASSSGTLCFENTFSQVSLNSGDTLAVTWTVNF